MGPSPQSKAGVVRRCPGACYVTREETDRPSEKRTLQSIDRDVARALRATPGHALMAPVSSTLLCRSESRCDESIIRLILHVGDFHFHGRLVES
jgi:hypothetical protein